MVCMGVWWRMKMAWKLRREPKSTVIVMAWRQAVCVALQEGGGVEVVLGCMYNVRGVGGRESAGARKSGCRGAHAPKASGGVRVLLRVRQQARRQAKGQQTEKEDDCERSRER